MNNKDKTISFRLKDKELEIFNNRLKELRMNKTDYIIMSCLNEKNAIHKNIAASSCVIKREIDILEEKLVRTGEISVEDLSGVKKELERRWK